jgi:hypothetical protein
MCNQNIISNKLDLNLSTTLSSYFIVLSFCRSVCLPVYYVCLSFCHCVVCCSIWLSACLSVCLLFSLLSVILLFSLLSVILLFCFFCLSVHPSVCCPSVCLLLSYDFAEVIIRLNFSFKPWDFIENSMASEASQKNNLSIAQCGWRMYSA